tara:strand:+ start:349 stop:867 length:519 start_codon:yes stop_codon:yes gene_type:complete
MRSYKSLILVGMMASGKSTIGSLVSKKLNLDFIDIDKNIEKNEGMKIFQIFKQKGEKHFREVEKNLTIEILNKKNCVISLGGGAFLNDEIRKKILMDHLSVWLNWSPSTIINRVKKNNKRPIINKLNKNEIEKLIKYRSSKYSLANFKLDCENHSKYEIVKKIIKLYEIKQT